MSSDSELLDEILRRWDFSWLSFSRWVRSHYPSTVEREHRAFSRVVGGLREEDRHPVREILILVARPGYWPQLATLAGFIRHLRVEHGIDALAPLELALLMIDAAKRHMAANPFEHAVDAMGWSRVPNEWVDVAVELGLVVRIHAHGASMGPKIPCVDEEDDEEPLDTPEPEDIESYEGYRTIRTTPWGGSPLDAVLAAAERVAGSGPQLEWRRALGRGATARAGDRRVSDVPRTLLSMLERLPRTHPRCLELYELLADTADDSLVASVERSISVMAEALGTPAVLASTTMRAAVRRMAADRTQTMLALTRSAFARMSDAEDLDGIVLAACLTGLMLPEEDPQEAVRWLERAWTMAEERERPEMRGCMLAVLHPLYQQIGDELGARRSAARARRLSRQYPHLAVLEELLLEPELDDLLEPEPEPEPWPLPLRQAEELFATGHEAQAFEAINDYIGGLFEDNHPERVVSILSELIERPGRLVRVTVWLCDAVAELVADDVLRWRAYKTVQLRAEDDVWLIRRAGHRLYDDGEDDDDVDDEELRAIASFRARQCIEEAEAALEQGQSEQARFWAKQARHYRKRVR